MGRLVRFVRCRLPTPTEHLRRVMKGTMQYRLTASTNDADTVLEDMAKAGWKVHTYHTIVETPLGYGPRTTHYILWENGDE